MADQWDVKSCNCASGCATSYTKISRASGQLSVIVNAVRSVDAMTQKFVQQNAPQKFSEGLSRPSEKS